MCPGLQGQDGETLRIPGQVRRDRLRGYARSNNPNGLETWARLSRDQNQTRLRSRTSRAFGSARAYASETRIGGATKRQKPILRYISAESRSGNSLDRWSHPKARKAGIFRRVDHKNDPLDSCRPHWLFV